MNITAKYSSIEVRDRGETMSITVERTAEESLIYFPTQAEWDRVAPPLFKGRRAEVRAAIEAHLVHPESYVWETD